MLNTGTRYPVGPRLSYNYYVSIAIVLVCLFAITVITGSSNLYRPTLLEMASPWLASPTKFTTRHKRCH